MHLLVRIDLDNDALTDATEVTRILQRVGKDYEQSAREDHFKDFSLIRDVNGNTVGEWSLES